MIYIINNVFVFNSHYIWCIYFNYTFQRLLFLILFSNCNVWPKQNKETENALTYILIKNDFF